MLADRVHPPEQFDRRVELFEAPPAPAERAPAGMRVQLLAFALSAGIVITYALRGGSYDSVVFGEHALVIWWVLAIGIAVGVLPRVRPANATLLVLAALLAFCVWTALSLIWSESSELTTVELSRALGYLGVMTLAAAVLDRTIWRPAALGLGFGALIVCCVSVGTRLAPSVFGTDQLDAALGSDRLSTPFGYWNAVAAWGAMSATMALAWSAHDHARVRRALALALVPVAGAMIYLSYSRAGIAGTAVGVIAVIALSRNRLTALIHALAAGAATAIVILVIHGEPEIARATGTAGAGSVFGALVLAAVICAAVAWLTGLVRTDNFHLPRAAARPLVVLGVLAVLIPGAAIGAHYADRAWHSFTRPPAARSANPTARLGSLSNSRYPLWKSAVHAWEAHPLDGIGAGAWQFWWNRNGTDGEFTLNAHNLWLEDLAELGVPGFALIVTFAMTCLSLLLAVRRRAKRSASAGAAAALAACFLVYLTHASVDWMWQSTAVTVVGLGAVGIAGARTATRRLKLGRWVRAAVAIVAAVAGALQIPGLLSTVELRRSQAAARAGNTALAMAWANDAVSAEPWSASAYEQRGLLEEQQGSLTAAAADLKRAISNEPTNWTHWLVLSRIRTEQDQLPAALSDYKEARHLRPNADLWRLQPYFSTPGHPFGILPVAPAATQGLTGQGLTSGAAGP